MKFNWKALVAVVVLVGALIWGVNSLRTRSYSGTDLNFGIGSGPVTVTNPSNNAMQVQLVGGSPGTFTVLSDTESVSGRSTSQGSGRSATQLYEFMLPSGVSEFTTQRGGNISFVADTDIPLEVTVQPLDAENARTTLVVAIILILGSLFFLSSMNGHRWISASRRQKASEQAAAQEAEQESFKRIFGRADKSS